MRRTAGVTHVTIFTRPDVCGGNCLYCPTVPAVPKSYLPHSNIARHGLSYSAAEQIRHWLGRNQARGGTGAKLEILVLGGSFTAHPLEYQEEFLRGIYEGVDGECASASLDALVERHHASTGRRIIGITVESRPNLITREVVDRLFAAGVTKIEMGVQCLDDAVLDFVERGHHASAVAAATRIIKDAGLKVGYHMLFGLPSASFESDVASSRRVFDDPDFQPDHLKIYFCEMFRREFMRPRLVELFDSGRWTPLDEAARYRLLEAVLPRVPRFMRISRIGRKIAGDELESPHVRIHRDVPERDFGCRCVRCREPFVRKETLPGAFEVGIEAISDREIFIEARPAGRDVCLGLLRLRLYDDRAVVRELHVYGLESAPGEEGRHQHRGIGKALMAEAERAVAERGAIALAVASGVGVRPYYSALGYALDSGNFMVKDVSPEGLAKGCVR